MSFQSIFNNSSESNKNLTKKDNFVIEKNSFKYYLLLLLVYFSFAFFLKVVQQIIYDIFPDNWLTNAIVGVCLVISLYLIFEKLRLGHLF